MATRSIGPELNISVLYKWQYQDSKFRRKNKWIKIHRIPNQIMKSKHSIDSSSDSDGIFDEDGLQPAYPSFYDESWTAESFDANKLAFSSTSSGHRSIVPRKTKGNTPVHSFCLYFDEKFVETIIDQTNLCYIQIRKEISHTSKMAFSCDVTIEGMHSFLATTILPLFTKNIPEAY